MAVISTNRNQNIKSLNIPDVLIDLLLKHSLNRERTLEMSSDELASVLGVDIDCAKLIQSSLRVLKN
jgi:hypothetical protein